MTCKNCGKEVQDDFPFCPFCGKPQVKMKKPTFTNYEWLSVCPEDKFAEEFEVLKHKDAEGARAWMYLHHDPVVVYTIHVTLWWESADRRRVWREINMTPVQLANSFDSARDIDCKHPDNITRMESLEKYLTRSDFKKLGDGVYWTKEECNQAIIDVFSEHGHGQYKVAEDGAYVIQKFDNRG